MVHRTVLRWHHKAQCATQSQRQISRDIILFTSYLVTPQTIPADFQCQKVDLVRIQQLNDSRLVKIEVTGKDVSLKSIVLRNDPVEVAVNGSHFWSIVVGQMNGKRSLDALEGGGLVRGFVPIQKDPRCCYV